MKDANKIDLGSIKVHKKVLAEIAESAVQDIDGVDLIQQDIPSVIGSFFGQKSSPGITVNVDKNNQVSLEIKVTVRYGLNIPEIARQTQDAVRTAIEKTVDIDLKDVNVNIQGIERGKS
jgi:uncharacterized alkaline shock family protein YloU